MTFDNAFPKLSQQERLQLEPMAICHEFADGEMVFAAGELRPDLFVVETGAIEVINPSDSNKIITTHQVGNFSGDIDLVIQRPISVTGIARGRTKVLRVPQEKLAEVLVKLPRLSEKLLVAFYQRREILTDAGKLGLRVMGPHRCKRTTLLREFLYKNFMPFSWVDPQSDEGQKECALLEESEFPVVLFPSGQVMYSPSLRELATEAGTWHHCPSQSVDLLIIGAGPAGIAAAVYASSEGVSTLVVDRLGPGGQAGGSSKIENFIGFPAGLSGTELALRGVLQMLKFGATMVAPSTVESIEARTSERNHHVVNLDCGAAIRARVVLVATGVTWRKLEASNADRWERAGVYYACTSVEATIHDEEDVAVVGGGNSAGQAAVYLAECCPKRKVHVMVRGKFGPSMSDYLCQRIAATPNIVVHEHTQIKALNGEDSIESADIITEGRPENLALSAVFVFIGAIAGSEWLPKTVERDEKGFVLTGVEVATSGNWPLKDRKPCPLETTVPGLLAAGDIRSGSTKRVGFAVGDGSLAVTCVHYLMSQD
jgi:thioredoxin reductase (NADPH)